MKRNIKKFIKDDIKQSYKFEYDKEQLLNDFVPKQKEKKVYQFTKLSIALHVAIICIIGIVIGGVIGRADFQSNNYVIKELKKYLMEEDFRIGSANLCYSLKISNGVNFHIYSFQLLLVLLHLYLLFYIVLFSQFLLLFYIYLFLEQ